MAMLDSNRSFRGEGRHNGQVERGRVNELHYMTPIANLASIVHYGLLSHHRAAEVPHDSIADPSVQGNRVGKRVPTGACCMTTSTSTSTPATP